MKAGELKIAVAMAKSDRDLSKYDDSPLHGLCCPDFPKKVSIELGGVARFLRYQCLMFNGGWDLKGYEEVRYLLVTRAEVIDLTAADYVAMAANYLSDEGGLNLV